MTKPCKIALLDQHLRKLRISILEANIQMQQKRIDGIYDKIAERQKVYPKDRIILESLSFQLHNLYCAYESLFRIVANYFENRIIDQDARNKKLLNRMKLNLAGIRPPLISEPAFVLLNELRGFRHVFRYNYRVKLEPDKIKTVLRMALILKKICKTDVATFLAQLKAKR